MVAPINLSHHISPRHCLLAHDALIAFIVTLHILMISCIVLKHFIYKDLLPDFRLMNPLFLWESIKYFFTNFSFMLELKVRRRIFSKRHWPRPSFCAFLSHWSLNCRITPISLILIVNKLRLIIVRRLLTNLFMHFHQHIGCFMFIWYYFICCFSWRDSFILKVLLTWRCLKVFYVALVFGGSSMHRHYFTVNNCNFHVTQLLPAFSYFPTSINYANTNAKK